MYKLQQKGEAYNLPQVSTSLTEIHLYAMEDTAYTYIAISRLVFSVADNINEFCALEKLLPKILLNFPFLR